MDTLEEGVGLTVITLSLKILIADCFTLSFDTQILHGKKFDWIIELSMIPVN